MVTAKGGGWLKCAGGADGLRVIAWRELEAQGCFNKILHVKSD